MRGRAATSARYEVLHAANENTARILTLGMVVIVQTADSVVVESDLPRDNIITALMQMTVPCHIRAVYCRFM